MTREARDVEFATELAAQIVDRFAAFIPFGIVLVNREGRVLCANDAAREMAMEGDGIRLSGDRLFIENSATGQELRKAIAEVVDQCDVGPGAVRIQNISRPSGLRPYRALITGMAARLRLGGELKFGCVFLSDNENNLCPEEPLLERFFGLTRAEAKVASLLAGGASLERITADLGIGMPTARTHLSRILEKTGAPRQAELVRIILTTPTLFQPRSTGPADHSLAERRRN